MDILESSDLGALLTQARYFDFIKAHWTGRISFNSMVVCDVTRAGQRLRMLDYAIVSGYEMNAKYMITNLAPLTLDLNEEVARDRSSSLEGNVYTTLGHALHHSNVEILLHLFQWRKRVIDATRPAVFMAAGEIVKVHRVCTGLQFAMMHGEAALLQLMIECHCYPVPSRLLSSDVTAVFIGGATMWSESHRRCSAQAQHLYKVAKLREEGALAAVWCCTRAVRGPWFDVWFHLAPHMALTDVDWMNDKGEATGRKRQRMDGQLKKK